MSLSLSIGDAVTRWLKHHLNRPSRAKCLVLIGPTATGKTTFAKSIPGRYNYFHGRWQLDIWSDFARFSIYDDVDWDQFEKQGFPPKKALLTQNGLTSVCIVVSDRLLCFVRFSI